MVIDIYCDESRQDLLASKTSISEDNKFCCIGGVMVPADARAEIKAKIKALKEKHGVYGEIKWSTVSPNKLPFYLDLIDAFFDSQDLFFRTVVIDASKVRNNVFNENDQELGYYKFYYQLLHRWALLGNQYRVFTDQKTNRDKKRLQELRRILNTQFPVSDTFESIQAIDSKESLILQMQNILMGAVGYKYNFRGEGSSYAKEQIVAKIESRLGRKIGKTYQSEQKFNVFEIALREER